MRNMRFFSLLLSIIFVVGCAAVGVVGTSDPGKKLRDANFLMDRGRPLPAERLILEAINIFQKKDDPHGLAYAYNEYAAFLRSSVLSERPWSRIYQKKGVFADGYSTYDKRFDNAKEYSLKALDSYHRAEKKYLNTGDIDELIHVYTQLGQLYYLFVDDIKKACNYYDLAIDAYNETVRLDPDFKPYVPSGTFIEYVESAKKDAECP